MDVFDPLAPLQGVQFFSIVVAFCFGAIFGSFLNVCVYRLPLDRSVVLPPSACVSCGTPLRWWQNIPILSYFLLGGRCHTCASPYSFRYAFVEALMATASVGLLGLNHGLGWMFFYHFGLVFLSVAVFLTDLDHWIIPDQLNFAGLAFGLVGSLGAAPRGDLELLGLNLGPIWGNLLSSLVGAGFGCLFFWVIQVFGLVMARQEAMGGGDVKYAAALGAFLGWQLAFVAFLLAFVLGTAVAIPIMLRGRERGKDPIPFGTFMALAAVPTALWGNLILAQFYRVSTHLQDMPFGM